MIKFSGLRETDLLNWFDLDNLYTENDVQLDLEEKNGVYTVDVYTTWYAPEYRNEEEGYGYLLNNTDIDHLEEWVEILEEKGYTVIDSSYEADENKYEPTFEVKIVFKQNETSKRLKASNTDFYKKRLDLLQKIKNIYDDAIRQAKNDTRNSSGTAGDTLISMMEYFQPIAILVEDNKFDKSAPTSPEVQLYDYFNSAKLDKYIESEYYYNAPLPLIEEYTEGLVKRWLDKAIELYSKAANGNKSAKAGLKQTKETSGKSTRSRKDAYSVQLDRDQETISGLLVEVMDQIDLIGSLVSKQGSRVAMDYLSDAEFALEDLSETLGIEL